MTIDGSAPRGLKRYAAVLADRRVRLATAGALTARLAQTTLPLALLLTAQARFDGFSAAGIVVSAYALASALGAPLLGRLADRRGRRVLLFAAGLSASALVVAAHGRSAGTMLVGATLAGVCTPPLGAALRAVVVLALPRTLHAAALTLDAVATEVLFIVGPAAAGLAVAVAEPEVALYGCAALTVLGAALFLLGATGTPRRPPDVLSTTSTVVVPVTVLLAVTALTAAVGLTEVSVTGRAEQWGSISSAGLLLGLWALGGASGGLAYGARDWPGTPRRHAMMLLPGVGLGFGLLAVPGSLPALLPFMVLAGVAVAPALTALARIVAATAPDDRGTEAFAWLAAATALGGAAGVAAGGLAVDQWSAGTGFTLAASLALVATALLMTLRPGLPD